MKTDNDKQRRVSSPRPKKEKKVSPLDVEGVDLGVTADEIVRMIQEDRERHG